MPKVHITLKEDAAEHPEIPAKEAALKGADPATRETLEQEIADLESFQRVLESPELSAKDCKLQHDLIQDNLVEHHHVTVDQETGVQTRETHKPNSPGEAGTVLDLGWVELLAAIIHDSAIVAQEA